MITSGYSNFVASKICKWHVLSSDVKTSLVIIEYISFLSNSAIHKAAGLSAALQNGLWRSFLQRLPFTPNGTFFSGVIEWWNSTRQSRETMMPAAL